MRPKVSVCIPIHNMKHKDYFLERALNSIRNQSFQDFEIVITEKGKMAENTNASIKEAKGEIIKILYMDDWLSNEDVLRDIVEAFDENEDKYWLIMGADTNPNPYWTDDIETGNNKLGSPSALAFRNHKPLLFDERMSWLLDCDLYKRLHKKHGKPIILSGEYVSIGTGDHQMTHILTDEEKLLEHKLTREKKYD